MASEAITSFNQTLSSLQRQLPQGLLTKNLGNEILYEGIIRNGMVRLNRPQNWTDLSTSILLSRSLISSL
jgi:hypothetical protein